MNKQNCEVCFGIKSIDNQYFFHDTSIKCRGNECDNYLDIEMKGKEEYCFECLSGIKVKCFCCGKVIYFYLN